MPAGGPRLLVLLGPTGTGKSAVAVAVARALDGEIVGCDALQIYREFDIGTGKPTAVERAAVPHHLVGVRDPAKGCTLAEYVRLAETAIAEIASRGRVPVVVGGTGLYLRGLLLGVVDAPPRDRATGDRLHAVVRRGGGARLHRWLARLDPDSAARIQPGDGQRVVRALELALGGEETWSERLARRGTWATGAERFTTLKFGLRMAPEALAPRLDARVDEFWSRGLVDEVRALLARVPPDANAWKAIGYREIAACLSSGCDPEEARAEMRRNTRRYAKRQRTWFRREPGVVWLDAEAGPEVLAEEILRRWSETAVLYSPTRGSE